MDADGREVWSLKRATEELASRTGINYSISGRDFVVVDAITGKELSRTKTVFSPLHAATRSRKTRAHPEGEPPKLASFEFGGVKCIYVDDFEKWYPTFVPRPGGHGQPHNTSPPGDNKQEGHDD